jgi:hypothetical protein
MPDTSLWPVVVGGLLTGLFTLGGIGAGLMATAKRDAAQERREAKKRRADKFEELIAALYEFEHWLADIRDREATDDNPFGPETLSPFYKVEAISSVYFPQFIPLIDELDQAATDYRHWMHRDMLKRVGKVAEVEEQPEQAGGEAWKSNTQLIKTETNLRGFKRASSPYLERQRVLLTALSEFARKDFDSTFADKIADISWKTLLQRFKASGRPRRATATDSAS